MFEHYTLPKSSEARTRKKLIELAEEVDESLEDSAADTSGGSQTYARAIEKGSNEKARRTDRHEVLCSILTPLLKKKG